MKRDDFIKRIETALDYVEFSVMDKNFTILPWYQKISIGEWDKPETVEYFTSITEMLETFKINGVSLIDCTDQIRIIDFS